MTELTREEKLKMIEKLPQRLQEFMYSEDTGVFLLYIGQKYKLPNEKIHLLSKIVGNIVLGIIPAASLPQEIALKISTDRQTVLNLARELNNDLLAPVTSPETAPKRAPIVNPPIANATKEDHYRETIALPSRQTPMPMPKRIVNLRRVIEKPITAPPISAPVSTFAPAPIPVVAPRPIMPSAAPKSPIKTPTPPISELKPRGLAVSLIEADPHKIIKPIPTSKPQIPIVSKQEMLKPAPIKPIIKESAKAPLPMPPLAPLQIIAPSKPPIKAPIPQQPQSPNVPSGQEIKGDEMPKAGSISASGRQDKPQFILRPPGLPPTDLSHDILDLRKDKGEF